MGNTLALIALGSNLGDRRATLDRAIADLEDVPGVVVTAVSSYHETAPVGGPGGQGAFLNAAAALETSLDPSALHRTLIAVEQHAGRVREVRWDARTLDLDLILYGDRIVDKTELTVPHPRFAVRRFVLAPMAEVAPQAVDPMTGRTVLDLLAGLDRRPIYVAIDSPSGSDLATRIAEQVSGTLGGRARLRGGRRPPESKGDLLTWFDQLASDEARLREARDLAQSSPDDPWIITDYCLSLDLLRSASASVTLRAGCAKPGRVQEIERRFDVIAATSSEAFPPTFCVPIGFRNWGWGLSFMEKAVDFPLLIPEATTEAGVVAEILAACRAMNP